MWGGIMRGYSSPASGSSPRGDASDHPEGVSKEAPLFSKGASGHPKINSLPKILKTEELSKKPLKIVKVEDVGEVIVDEDVKDIRVRINDVIIKITFDDSGLKEILVDEVVYKKSTRKEIDFCPKCGSELVDTILDAVDNNDYDFIDDKLCIEVECPNCNHRFVEVWGWRGRKEK
jgi:uncharacterized protein with PIN domain